MATSAPVSLRERAQRSYQSDCNRRFVVADLLDELTIGSWTPGDLLVTADAWAALLRDALRQRFPDRRFEVEVIGREGAEDEPLDLCVTFYQT